MSELKFRVDGLTEEQVQEWRPRQPPRRISGIAVAAASLLAIALYSRIPASPIVGVVAGIDFGEQSIRGTGRAQTVAIANRGSAALVITRVAIEGAQPNAFVLDSNSCGTAGIAPGRSCAVEVRFTSRSPGSRLAQLVITDNAFDSPQRVALSGTAVVPGPPRARITPTPMELGSPQVRGTDATPPVAVVPRTRITPSPVEFGTPKAARPESLQVSRSLVRELVTVENVGTAPLLVSGVDVRGTPEFALVSEGCTRQPIRPREVCTIELRFTPRGSGARRAQLVVSDNAADSPHTVPLSGRGMDVTPQVSRIRIAPSSVDFGTTRSVRSEGLKDFSRQQPRASSQVRRVTVESAGTASLVISSLNVRGPAGQEFIVVSQDCTRQPVTTGQSCSIDVRFSPHGSGARQAQLVISDNAAGSPHAVTLSGTMLESTPPKPRGDREGIELIPRPRGDRGIVEVKPRPQGDQGAIELKPKRRDDRGIVDVKPKPQGHQGAIELKPKSRDELRKIEPEKPPPPPPVVR